MLVLCSCPCSYACQYHAHTHAHIHACPYHPYSSYPSTVDYLIFSHVSPLSLPLPLASSCPLDHLLQHYLIRYFLDSPFTTCYTYFYTPICPALLQKHKNVQPPRLTALPTIIDIRPGPAILAVACTIDCRRRIWLTRLWDVC